MKYILHSQEFHDFYGSGIVIIVKLLGKPVGRWPQRWEDDVKVDLTWEIKLDWTGSWSCSVMAFDINGTEPGGHLFIHNLFSNAVDSSDYAVSNGRIIDE